jgi:hypothetical protein
MSSLDLKTLPDKALWALFDTLEENPQKTAVLLELRNRDAIVIKAQTDIKAELAAFLDQAGISY